MRLPQTETEYLNNLVDAAEMGSLKTMMLLGKLNPFIKLKEAQKMYGASVVNRWIKEGLIQPIKDGPNNASVRIDRLRIEAVAKSCNRTTYLTTKERLITKNKLPQQ